MRANLARINIFQIWLMPRKGPRFALGISRSSQEHDLENKNTVSDADIQLYIWTRKGCSLKWNRFTILARLDL